MSFGDRNQNNISKSSVPDQTEKQAIQPLLPQAVTQELAGKLAAQNQEKTKTSPNTQSPKTSLFSRSKDAPPVPPREKKPKNLSPEQDPLSGIATEEPKNQVIVDLAVPSFDDASVSEQLSSEPEAGNSQKKSDNKQKRKYRLNLNPDDLPEAGLPSLERNSQRQVDAISTSQTPNPAQEHHPLLPIAVHPAHTLRNTVILSGLCLILIPQGTMLGMFIGTLIEAIATGKIKDWGSEPERIGTGLQDADLGPWGGAITGFFLSVIATYFFFKAVTQCLNNKEHTLETTQDPEAGPRSSLAFADPPTDDRNSPNIERDSSYG